MARKRMIDPNFWRDEKIAQCTPTQRLLFIGLWNFAEDTGVGRASPKLIKADIFPYDTLKDSDIEKGLDRLAELRMLRLYEHENQKYYFIINFKKHQTINKPTKPTLPLPEDYGSTTTPLPPNIREDKLSKEEENRREICKAAIDYLNAVGKKRYSLTESYYSHMNARINEGAVLEDFKRVIDIKCAGWNNEPQEGQRDMRQYLRPETLFGTKFQGYLNEAGPVEGHKNGDRREDGRIYLNGKWVIV